MRTNCIVWVYPFYYLCSGVDEVICTRMAVGGHSNLAHSHSPLSFRRAIWYWLCGCLFLFTKTKSLYPIYLVFLSSTFVIFVIFSDVFPQILRRFGKKFTNPAFFGICVRPGVIMLRRQFNFPSRGVWDLVFYGPTGKYARKLLLYFPIYCPHPRRRTHAACPQILELVWNTELDIQLENRVRT